ncbi:MAG TPA: hypothetical protein VHA12_00140 [Candidatus Nanoarchaeia archaeon]|nr:hypothetical protein [Candidatus Nanoarchaeia archaeon]
MTGKKGMHNIGRPTLSDDERTIYQHKAFYFPQRNRLIWLEFYNLALRKFRGKRTSSNVISIAIRSFIYNFVKENTDNATTREAVERKIANEITPYINN